MVSKAAENAILAATCSISNPSRLGRREHGHGTVCTHSPQKPSRTRTSISNSQGATEPAEATPTQVNSLGQVSHPQGWHHGITNSMMGDDMGEARRTLLCTDARQCRWAMGLSGPSPQLLRSPPCWGSGLEAFCQSALTGAELCG